ncbi:phage head-tail connector protein [Clostridium sp. P21]|uniref:Phage head-tail connector protein n=1 Tax=Clostridium muellerianum TaxID=2716538 RepID=A0A7Y0HPM7_9CLOT|nr:phage head-tail connector protein [Clostridium muellerianum]NMM64395.1 phage head-tail connector protein [Clostridium muellerianum]
MTGSGTGQIIETTVLLSDIKTLLRIKETDNSKDGILNIYLRRGNNAIIKYLNNPSITDATAYPDALIEYVLVCYRRNGNEGIKQSSVGSQSATWEGGLPKSVKELLPLPYIQLL